MIAIKRALLAALLLSGGASRAEAPADDNFANLSFEELANIRVTSVSKKPERLGAVAASVFVIRSDDIRRAGATSLPEALRLAPNLQVARLDARNYAVTARGFNNAFENKLLVLIDGRTVYSPLFSGVYWDAQDVVLEDIARIEVISGPGATLWGANAVNGVINIITRNAADTQGELASIGSDGHGGDVSVRHGAVVGDGHYRLYAKHAEADDTRNADGVATVTGWQRDQAGFRADLSALGGRATLSGDAYRGQLRQFNTADIGIGGANLLARLTRPLDGGGELRLQAYVDQVLRDQPNAFRERLDTVDVEFQHSMSPGTSQQLVWGGGHRVARDHITGSKAFTFLPLDDSLAWTNLFAQHDWHITPQLRLTTGLKAERNSYTGMETLPSASLAWQATPEQLLWLQVARAVRVPSRIDRDFYAPGVPPVVAGQPRYNVAGGPNFVSEVERVAQAGYRGQPWRGIGLAATVFFSRYDKVRTLEPNPAGAGLVFMNQAEAHSHGLELSANWEPRSDLRLSGGAVFQRLHVNPLASSHDVSGVTNLSNNDPERYSMLRLSYDVSAAMELDATLRHQGTLPKPLVPAYTALDVRAGWKLGRTLELSLLLQNLLAGDHPEFGASPGRSIIARTAAARLTWRF